MKYAPISIIIIFSILIACDSQKDQCENVAETSNNSRKPICDFLFLDAARLSNPKNENSINENRAAVDKDLLLCLDHKLAMQKCQRKSDFIPYWIK
jgi:hypothetical protein